MNVGLPSSTCEACRMTSLDDIEDLSPNGVDLASGTNESRGVLPRTRRKRRQQQEEEQGGQDRVEEEEQVRGEE